MMSDFLELIATVAYFGSPLFFGAVAGLGFGALSSRKSARRSLLWGLGIGLVGVIITTAIVLSYSYWNNNLRDFPSEKSSFDHFMISIRPMIVFSPLCLAGLTVGATLLVLRLKPRETLPLSMSHLPQERT